MILSIRFILAYLMCLTFCVACLDKTDKNVKNNIENQDFKREVQKSRTDSNKVDSDWQYKLTIGLAEALKLDHIESGFDSLQVRIWLGHSMAINQQVVVLSYTDKRWEGKLVTYELSDKNDPSELIKNERERDIFPKDGWQKLESEIRRLRITSLSHSENIPSCDGCGGSDGITYIFEISSLQLYRFYFYCNPDLLISECEEAMKVLEFSKLLENQFDFSYTK